MEHAIGILKKRFSSLNGLRMRVNKIGGHRYACNWISACCVLYNYLLHDPWTEEDVEQDKQALRNVPNVVPDDDETDEDSDEVAIDKGNALKDFISNRM